MNYLLGQDKIPPSAMSAAVAVLHGSTFQSGVQVLPFGKVVPHTHERLYPELIKHGKSRKEKASESDPRRLPAFIWEVHSEDTEIKPFFFKNLTQLRKFFGSY